MVVSSSSSHHPPPRPPTSTQVDVDVVAVAASHREEK